MQKKWTNSKIMVDDLFGRGDKGRRRMKKGKQKRVTKKARIRLKYMYL